MDSGVSDTYDIYLVLSPFRDVVPDLQSMLGGFAEIEGGGLLAGADAYYSPKLDSALIALRFHRARAAPTTGSTLLRKRLAKLRLPVIVPDELSFERRCAFYLDHMSYYTTCLQQHGPRSGRTSMLSKLVAKLSANLQIGASPVESSAQ